MGGILGPFNAYVDLIEWCLRQLMDFTGNGGLAIILFTVILKTVLLPLTVKSIKSTAAMQELQPKIKEVQNKYKKDRAKVSEETMKLYQEYQINPAAGCLPMLIQIPIFFGLFYAVRSMSGDAGHFLWMQNLSNADPYKILPIAAGIFQFMQTKMMRPANAPKASDPQTAMMNTMMNFMPLMVVIFGWSFSAAVVLYWAVQSIYSVVQQWLITGWGSLKNWFPFLEKFELPEHRRLGYRKEALEKREIDPNAPQKGFMGYLNRQAQAAEERRKLAEEARSRGTTGSTDRSAPARKATPVADDDDDTPPVDTTNTTRVMSGPAARRRSNRK